MREFRPPGIIRAGRLVGGHEGLQHRTAVFARLQRLLVVGDAIDEVGHFLGEAVVPGLLVDGEAPARRAAGLLHGVVVALSTIRYDRVAAQEVGHGDPLGAVHFGPVVHAAQLRPALFGQANATVVELDNHQRVVVAPGLVGVDLRRQLGVDRRDLRLVEHPAEELDGVTAHVQRDAAARTVDVPEVRRVRTFVLL
jgi:hypothetical protein